MSVKQEDFDALKKQFEEMEKTMLELKKSGEKAAKAAKAPKETKEEKEARPKKPLTKYQEFVKSEYPVIKANNPGIKGPEIFKKVTENWKAQKPSVPVSETPVESA